MEGVKTARRIRTVVLLQRSRSSPAHSKPLETAGDAAIAIGSSTLDYGDRATDVAGHDGARRYLG